MGAASSKPPRICVVTHRDPDVVGDGVATLVYAAERAGIELLASEEEADKHPTLIEACARANALGWPGAAMGADAAIVLAGDGTLLRVLNQLRDGPPVLGVNYGMLGYLSGVGADRIEDALGKLAKREFRVIELATLSATFPGGEAVALNDVVASGGVTGRIVELAWRIVSTRGGGSEVVDVMGTVPCDGMVLATPVGSTAYNLSNGGPVMAWGVDGFVVSFIAPHTLAARPLVVAPGDVVELEHTGRGAPLKVLVDGRSEGRLRPGERMRVGIGTGRARLAMLDDPTLDTSFYARYRDNFASQLTNFDRARVRAEREAGSRRGDG